MTNNDERCLNGHNKAKSMNDRGICSRCAEHYRERARAVGEVKARKVYSRGRRTR